MSLPDYKALKKLADTCRKAGIKHFKNADLEFTLTEDFNISPVLKKSKDIKKSSYNDSVAQDLFQSDSLTEDQLLFYSVANDPAEDTTKKDS